MQLGKLMIFVPDLEEAKHFYCDILGFPLQVEDGKHLEFGQAGCAFIAFKCERSAAVENYSRVARSVFVFEVPSIDQTLGDLRAKGVNFLHQEPAENEFCRYAAFTDPFGDVHEISQSKTIVT